MYKICYILNDMKICFVCHANICRSFMAQEILKKLCADNRLQGFEVFSRGVYADPELRVPQKIKDFLKTQNIDYSGHTPVPLTKGDFAAADLVLFMEAEHLDLMLDKYAQYSDKMYLLMDYAYGKEQDVEDPIGMQGRAFVCNAGDLNKAVEQVFKKLKAA